MGYLLHVPAGATDLSVKRQKESLVMEWEGRKEGDKGRGKRRER